jgi:hypothetical protein
MVAFLLIVGSLLGGTATTYLYDEDADFYSRMAAGAALGWAAACLVCYALSSFLGLGTVSCLLAAAAALAPLLVLRQPRLRARFLSDLGLGLVRPRVFAALFLLVFFATLMCARAYFVTPAGIFTGDAHNFGDLGFHLAITTDFVYGQRFPPDHPTFSGASLTYPFLMDFGAGMLVVGGMSLHDAYLVESSLLFVCLLLLFHRWARLLTGDSLAATLAVCLVVFSGGLGWWTFLKDAQHSPQSVFSMLGHLARDYTISPRTEDELRWGNTVTALLLSQRTLLMGIPLALIAFTAWWQTLTARGTTATMVAGGVATGLLPLTHAHSYLVVNGLAVCVALLFWRRLERAVRLWGAFFACSIAVGLPQILWIMAGSHLKTSGFFAWQPGWDKGPFPWVPFWIYNSGLFIPLLVIALIERDDQGEWLVERRTALYYAPFCLCFLAANLLKMAPWIWDNIKVLVYWLLASAPMIGRLLAVQLREKTGVKALAIVLLVMLTAAGALDVWRVADGQESLMIVDAGGEAFAAAVREHTPRNALVLHAAVANHPLVLAGRRSLMGYPGHVWSQGFDPGTRESDIKAIYAGLANAIDLLHRYKIDYIALGPQERGVMTVNERFLARWPAVLQSGQYTLYQVTSNLQGTSDQDRASKETP